jgi:hypothetical protein
MFDLSEHRRIVKHLEFAMFSRACSGAVAEAVVIIFLIEVAVTMVVNLGAAVVWKAKEVSNS